MVKKVKKIDKSNAGARTGFRGTKAQIEARKNDIETLMAAGYGRKSILQYITTKYSLAIKQIDNYIAEITARWEKEFEGDSKKNLIKALKKRESIIEKTYSEKDYKTALSAMDSESKLLGLFKDKFEVSGGLSSVGKDEIEEILKGIAKYDKLKEGKDGK